MIFFLFLKFFLRLVRYFFSDTKRYSFLLWQVFKNKPKSIIEVGVYNGRRAIELIETAKIFNKKINYYGFDLFEDFYKKKKMIEKESSKFPLSKKQIERKINFLKNIKLIKGNTRITLQKFSKKIKKVDFVFLDGGHSLTTIKSDWKHTKKMISSNSIVVFDDYYETIDNLKNKFGCNKVIDSLSNKKYVISKNETGDIFFDKYFNVNKKIFMVSVKKK